MPDADLPGLPINSAADALLATNPVLGGVIIFEAAAIIALSLFVMRLVGQLNTAKTDHIADLKLSIPAMQDLRNTVLEALAHPGTRRGRT